MEHGDVLHGTVRAVSGRGSGAGETTPRPRGQGEQGVTMILVALTMVTMMVFAAFAVDIGGVYAERRQDQTAADVAALAAVQALPEGDAAIVATVKDYVHEALGEELPAGADGWNSCPRPDGAALATQAAAASCVSYDRTRVRVRLPDRFYPASFGRVVGIDDYRHAAFAVAELAGAGFGGVLPFFATDAQVAQGYDCLIADGPSECANYTGKFGVLDFANYEPSCTDGSLPDNIAMGNDHDLSLFGQAPHHLAPVRSTAGSCPAQPNATDAINGNAHSQVRSGLVLGEVFRDGGPARLQRSDPALSLPRIDAFGVDLDNTPLWWFIPPDYGPGEPQPANIPTSCRRDQFVDPDGDYYADLTTNLELPPAVAANLNGKPLEQDRVLGLLARCFRHYLGEPWDGYPVTTLATAEPPVGCVGACDDPVFARNSSTSDEPDLYDIQYTPRFGYAPQDTALDSGSQVEFHRFRAVYLYRVMLGNQNNTNKSVRWDPGTAPEPGPSAPSNAQTAVQAFFFPDAMVPGGLGSTAAPTEVGVNRFVRLVR